MAINRRNHPVTLLQATQNSPVLARLTELSQESATRLKALEPLMPKALFTAVRPGPVDGSVWCLLLDNNASAAKLRQLLPTFEAHLRSKGFDVASIRLRVQSRT